MTVPADAHPTIRIQGSFDVASSPRTAPAAADQLSIGARGDHVRFVQGCRRDGGLLAADGVDGESGPQTAAAVREFQRRTGLPATGEVDGSSRTALEQRVPRAVPVEAEPARQAPPTRPPSDGGADTIVRAAISPCVRQPSRVDINRLASRATFDGTCLDFASAFKSDVRSSGSQREISVGGVLGFCTRLNLTV
ncbi:MAG: hypothetical protein FJ137_03485 [Deltaproteobacteria bacterium]|nr:hypothetical protein [Deltaproteobacteria bacterium]